MGAILGRLCTLSECTFTSLDAWAWGRFFCSIVSACSWSFEQKKRRDQPYKPGSVSHPFTGLGEATISLGLRSPAASNDLPGNERWGRHHASLFGLSPGGVYPASLVTKTAVRSYRTVSPLPRTCARGGLFSVALSLASRPVAVSNHLDPWSPDFPLCTRLALRTKRLPRLVTSGGSLAGFREKGRERGRICGSWGCYSWRPARYFCHENRPHRRPFALHCSA